MSRLKENGVVTDYEKAVNRKIRVYYYIEKSGLLLYQRRKGEFYEKFDAVDNILKGINQ